MGKKAILTGATGHIGSTVASFLLDRDYELTLLVRRITPTVEALRNRGAILHLCNLSKEETYLPVLQGQDVLFHLAAENTTDSSDEKRVIDACLGLTEQVLTAAQKAKVGTIIYTSSVVVLGRSANPSIPLDEHARVQKPESPYVKGKLLAEQWVESQLNSGADIRRVYPSWVVGPGNPNLTPPHKFIKDFAAKGQAIYFDGGVSIAHVEDVAMGHILAYEKGKPQGQYVLSGDNVTFKQLYDCLADVFNQPKPKFRIPKPVIYTGAVVLGPISPIQPSYVQAVINRYSWYTANRAEQELGYTSRPLLATIQSVKIEIQKRILGTFFIEDRKTSAPVVAHNPDEKLLITGFPGWFCNRIIDIFINGDNDGLNKTNRKVRLLVQPHLLNLVPTLPSNFEVFVGDVTDKESLLHATRGVTAVWHAAGVIYPKNIDLFEKVNAQGTRNVADACVANGVRRMMYMSTDSTCGYSPEGTVFSATEAPNPYKTYGKSKYAGEQYITQLTAEGKLDATTFRGFWFFGPNIPMRNLAFFQAFTWPFVPVFGNGRNLRSISHCDDMLNAFVKAEHAPATYGKWYWLPAFVQAQTVDQIYSMVAKGLQSKAMLLHIPNFICNICDSVDSYLTNKKQILNPTIHAAGKFHKTIATDAAGIAPAKADFGWEPKVTALQIQQEIRDSLASN